MSTILFVCLGNICRSPLAEGIFREKLKQHSLDGDFHLDSAAIKGYHVGKSPDKRAMMMAKINEYDISNLRAREITVSDFEKFDLIIGMDKKNIESLKDISPLIYHYKIKLMLDDYAPSLGLSELADPYKGNLNDFQTTIDHLEIACENLLKEFLEL
ncbi:low molecular weight protein-tyrosine-phosphatase [Kangiella sp. HZ709]|uniref:low molecular weight protein-tyrosine-phosphatase n=1 Tax=Kangiella sp. HZ709 TaxID=2666328 RepID=UPI0018A230C8|nr:low molecular weight protein-tyrosine-phosphatase [Kangiella sp. HZ709]